MSTRYPNNSLGEIVDDVSLQRKNELRTQVEEGRVVVTDTDGEEPSAGSPAVHWRLFPGAHMSSSGYAACGTGPEDSGSPMTHKRADVTCPECQIAMFREEKS